MKIVKNISLRINVILTKQSILKVTNPFRNLLYSEFDFYKYKLNNCPYVSSLAKPVETSHKVFKFQGGFNF